MIGVTCHLQSANLTSPLELLLDTLPLMSQRVIEAVIWDSHIHGCIVNDLPCRFVSIHCCIVQVHAVPTSTVVWSISETLLMLGAGDNFILAIAVQ